MWIDAVGVGDGLEVTRKQPEGKHVKSCVKATVDMYRLHLRCVTDANITPAEMFYFWVTQSNSSSSTRLHPCLGLRYLEQRLDNHVGLGWPLSSSINYCRQQGNKSTSYSSSKDSVACSQYLHSNVLFAYSLRYNRYNFFLLSTINMLCKLMRPSESCVATQAVQCQ